MQIIEYLKSLFWTPPPMPAYKLPLVARITGVERIIKEVGEFFFAQGFLDGFIAGVSASGLLVGTSITVCLLISRRTNASPR